MQIDEVVNYLNTKFLFKIIAFLVLSFPTFQNYGQLQGILAAVVVPNYTCQYTNVNTNFTISVDQCTIKINGSLGKCNKWNFSKEPVGNTIISDFQLVCDKRNRGDTILIVWYVTSFTGIAMSWASDRYGRKVVVIFNVILEIVSSILCSVSPNYASTLIFRFFLGISASSVYISFVWLMEMVDYEFRDLIGSFFWLFGCVAYAVFPLIIYLTKNWRVTQLVSIIPSVLYFCIFFIPESPRWLLVRGRKKNAFESMKTMAKINKLHIEFNINDIVEEEDHKTGNILLALKSRTFVIRSVITFFTQFSVYIIYAAITVNVSILSNNFLLSMFLVGIMETPGLFLSYFTLRFVKRKHNIIIFALLGSVLIWGCTFFSRNIYWQSVIRIVIGCVAKTLIACVNFSSMVYVAELFPTSHRSYGFGWVQLANFLSFIGAIYINKLAFVHKILPMTIYLILIVSSCLLVYLFLPETRNIPFSETLVDQTMLQHGKEDQFIEYMKKKNNHESVPLHTVDETKSLENDSGETSNLINRKNS